MPQRFWNVYSYVARQWYETEYGALELPERWYYSAMLFLERIAADSNENIRARRVRAERGI